MSKTKVVVMSNFDLFDETLDVFEGFSISSIERRAFKEHLHKVYHALSAIYEVDQGYSSYGKETKYICDCIYDFESQEIIETSTD